MPEKIELHTLAGKDTKSFMQIMHSERQRLANDEEYIKLLEAYLSKHYFENYIRSRQGLWPYKTKSQERAEEIIKQHEKFMGKKILKTRINMYKEIEKKYHELNEEGANAAYVTATNIVAKKNGESRQKLYQSFMKYKNRQNAKSK